jgi:DNA-directed RNA polymerase specialized sigma24 family protein
LLAASDPANEKAWAAFESCYAALIRDWCRRRRLQDADQEDVVQTILCRLRKMMPTFQYDSNKRFRGLLDDMVSHAIADLHRARQRQPGICGSGDTRVVGQLHGVQLPDDSAVEELTQDLTGQVERDQQLHEACERVRRRVKKPLISPRSPSPTPQASSIDGSAEVSRTFAEGPGTLVGPYKLLEKIGGGGMGVV